MPGEKLPDTFACQNVLSCSNLAFKMSLSISPDVANCLLPDSDIHLFFCFFYQSETTGDVLMARRLRHGGEGREEGGGAFLKKSLPGKLILPNRLSQLFRYHISRYPPSPRAEGQNSSCNQFVPELL